MSHQPYSADAPCPCGSGQDFAHCCGPLLEGSPAANATALMRSRYTAFALHDYDYLVESTHPDFRDGVTAETLAQNAANITWLKLEIRDAQDNLPAPEGVTRAEGTFSSVTFVALFELGGKTYQHAETSYFQEYQGHWRYVEGLAHRPQGQRRTTPKVGRNDPCPCGSGKKYKKCCALKEGA